MKSPLIGITTYRTRNRQGYAQICLNEAYVTALEGAGAQPCLIPPGLSTASLEGLLGRLDGVIFSGGGDIQPERYGSQPHPLVENVDPDRDQTELFLLQRLVDSGTPFLGICRGMQIINVGLGGSLFEDILDQRPDSLRHQSPDEWPRDRLAHPVQVEPDTRLYEILGQSSLQVNSQHHQAVRRLAPALRPAAFAPDGVLEACELPDHPFGVAVQWHPEWLQAHPPMQALFRSLVEACRQRQRA